jgi:adenylyltransferase/sulfurtransferase
MTQPLLSPSELIRYARHLILPEVGAEGQRRLKSARVLLVGAGGLGSPAALYLAAAGVGTLGIVDDDRVELGNLHRQVLHGTGGLGQPKTDSASSRLHDLNPEVRVEAIRERLTSANALALFSRYDVVVDGSDNFPTRYLVNDTAVLTGRRYVYGSIFRFDGQVSVFAAPGGPCYRCLFAEPPAPELVPSCAEAGVLGVLPAIIGSLQALEAIKLVLGIGDPLIGRLLLFDGLRLQFRELVVRRDPACPACGTRSITHLFDYEAFCGAGSDHDATAEITVPELHGRLDDTGPLLVDVREPWEWEIVRIPGSVHIPLSSLGDRLSEIDARREVVTICHRGMRSEQARDLLRAAGYAKVRSLAGGIDAWAAEADSNPVRY